MTKHAALVAALRSYRVGPKEGPLYHPPICDEAADALERLRNKVIAAEMTVRAYKTVLDQLSAKRDGEH